MRQYSERRFKMLAMLPGEIDDKPLGEAMRDVLAALGEVSRRYLRDYDTGSDKRWYETISIERLDRSAMPTNASLILKKLLEYNLLVDEGITFTRAQVGLAERFDLNKILAPAFQITYRVRNHMYLSKQQLEQLLTEPGRFVGFHRNKLADLIVKRDNLDRTGDSSLFKDHNDD